MIIIKSVFLSFRGKGKKQEKLHKSKQSRRSLKALLIKLGDSGANRKSYNQYILLIFKTTILDI